MYDITRKELAEAMQKLNNETVDGNNAIEYTDIGTYIELAGKLAHQTIIDTD